MTLPTRLISRSFMVGVLIVSTAQGSSALTVTRCNQLNDGVYRPVLVVEHAGGTTVHSMGENGLTRSILFNPAAALAWAQGIYGADAAVVSSSGACTDNSSGPGVAAVIMGDDDEDDDTPDDDDDDDDGGITAGG